MEILLCIFNRCCVLRGKRRSLLPALCGQPVALRLIVVLHRGGGVQDGGAQIGHDILDGWVVLDITSKMYSTCWLVSLSSRSRMAFGGLRLLADVLGLSWTAVHSTMLSNNSSSLSGSYRWARVSISSRSRNSSRTCASIWSKSADSSVSPDRLVLCLLVFCLLVFCCAAFSKLLSQIWKIQNGEEQGFMRLDF